MNQLRIIIGTALLFVTVIVALPFLLLGAWMAIEETR